MTSSRWQVLRDGDAGLILTVAFDAGRGDARFADLASFLQGRHVLEGVPLRSTVAELVKEGPDAYVEPWLEAVKELGQPVRAVFGHCAGSGLARELFGRLRTLGLGEPTDEPSGEPSLIAFDPILVDSHILADDYRAAVRTLAAQLSPQDLESALVAAGPCDDGPTLTGVDVLPLAEALETAYGTAVAAACERLSVAPAVQQQLSDRFSHYLAYLAAAAWAQATPPARDTPPATTVLSTTGGVGTDDADPRGTVTRFTVDRTRLLADPDVAAYVSRATGG
ncbi:hypothetical protein AB0I94_28250 [Streptomyces sp. NPDC050147]|uniref:hypothetical protein n=1 Tax=Streptomyces sp. NPDC050147 TaxID=3155513 RepID=UPI00341DAF12